MKDKKDKILVGYLIFTSLVFFGYALATSIYYAPSSDTSVEPATISYDKKLNYQNGIKIDKNFTPQLEIPAINVIANIQYVGLNKNGNMATPNNFFDVGLYKYGTNPGNQGSAVIAGHVDNGLGLKAVFGNLEKLNYGDDIWIEMEEGEKTHFLVVSKEEYDYNERPEEVFKQNDNSYLKLITCSGSWIKELRTHNKRLVVTAIKI